MLQTKKIDTYFIGLKMQGTMSEEVLILQESFIDSVSRSMQLHH